MFVQMKISKYKFGKLIAKKFRLNTKLIIPISLHDKKICVRGPQIWHWIIQS